MKERPILFSGQMVKALLAGTKTQTRRLMKPQPEEGAHMAPEMGCALHEDHWGNPIGTHTCPYGKPVDRLWVRESLVMLPDGSWHYDADKEPIALRGDDPRCGAMISWAHHNERERCNSIHMPRWASRITLEVTSVGVERLQTMGDADARAEGFEHDDLSRGVTACTARDRFAILWDEINGKRARWDSNPWVWVVGFRRLL